ncbi:hypothetical protein T484DRAFT_1819490 [Baffinella frigidus]|nr:hypothetical protein T484DRAFT_1819490 [Cryptophyta sp. CCMP2293]
MGGIPPDGGHVMPPFERLTMTEAPLPRAADTPAPARVLSWNVPTGAYTSVVFMSGIGPKIPHPLQTQQHPHVCAAA